MTIMKQNGQRSNLLKFMHLVDLKNNMKSTAYPRSQNYNYLIIYFRGTGGVPCLSYPSLAMNKAGIYEHSNLLPLLEFIDSLQQ